MLETIVEKYETIRSKTDIAQFMEILPKRKALYVEDGWGIRRGATCLEVTKRHPDVPEDGKLTAEEYEAIIWKERKVINAKLKSLKKKYL